MTINNSVTNGESSDFAEWDIETNSNSLNLYDYSNREFISLSSSGESLDSLRSPIITSPQVTTTKNIENFDNDFLDFSGDTFRVRFSEDYKKEDYDENGMVLLNDDSTSSDDDQDDFFNDSHEQFDLELHDIVLGNLIKSNVGSAQVKFYVKKIYELIPPAIKKC